MKRIALLAAAGLVAAGSAFAMAHADMLADLDTDGDGAVSQEELAVLLPDLTDEDFAAIDTSADGSVDLDELGAAIEAGLVTME